MLKKTTLRNEIEYGVAVLTTVMPEDQGAVPYTSPFSLPLYGGPVVTIHAEFSDVLDTNGLRCSVSPNETGAPIMGSSGQRASIRSCRGFLFPRPLRPGHNGIVQKPAWYKCIRSAET